MTDREFEKLLEQKAAAMPLPLRGPVFLERKMNRGRIGFRAALVLLAAVMVVTATVAAYDRTSHGLRATLMGATLDKTHYRVGGARFRLPEELGGLAYEKDQVYSLVPHDASFWEALFTPRYRYVSVDYGGGLALDVSAGTLEGPYWQHVFSYRDGEPDREALAEYGLNPAGEEDYGDCRLFCFQGDGRSSVTWLDQALGLCFDVTVWETAGDLETALTCAREIIDLNQVPYQ